MIRYKITSGTRFPYFLLILMVLLIGCTDAEPNGDLVYLGGQVINPTFSNASFLAGDRQILTTALDEDNRFHFELGKLAPGLYHFRSGEEQALYLEPGDSLLLRVNTKQFDESISFSGRGARRNDFLMELYLLNESVNKHLVDQRAFFSEPGEFRDVLTSSRSNNYRVWERFREKHKESENFAQIVQIILDYENYARLEVYPLTGYRGEAAEVLKQLPSDFYDYRQNIDFNMEQAISLYSYQRFLNNYFNHKAFESYSKEQDYNPATFSHNMMKLREINNRVENDSVRNFMLQRVVRDYLMNSNDKKGGEMLYEYYNEHANSPFYKKQIDELYTNNKNIESGKRVPAVQLKGNASQDTILLSKIIDRPSVLYFWKTTRTQHNRDIHHKIEKLRQRFPEFDYIGIRLDRDTLGWKNYLRKHPDFAEHAYHIDEPLASVRQKLSINSILKTFIVDENGIIVNGHANAFSSDFEEELLGFLNR